MRKMIAALVAAGLLFAGACGGDDDDSSDAAGTGDGGDGSEFCDQAVALFSDPGNDSDAALDAAEQLEPPDEIADDWETLVTGSRDAAEATANLDPNDPNAAAEFSEQYEDLIAASTNVYNYLGEECGMEGFTPPDASDLTVPSVPGE